MSKRNKQDEEYHRSDDWHITDAPTGLFSVSLLFVLTLQAAFVCAQDSTRYFELISRAQPDSLSKEAVEMTMSADSKKDVLAQGYLANRYVLNVFDEYGYRYTGGRYTNALIKFRLRLPPEFKANPDANPDKKYPLIISFHGGGEGGSDNHRHLTHLHLALDTLTGPEAKQFFVLSTQHPKGEWWCKPKEWEEDSYVFITAEIIDNLIADFPIDSKKISYIGFCSGAIPIYWLYENRQHYGSAAVIISHNPHHSRFEEVSGVDESPTDAPFMHRMNIWWFYGGEDTSVNPGWVRAYNKAIIDRGGRSQITVCEREPGDRHDSWKAAFIRYKVVDWLLEQVSDDTHNADDNTNCSLASDVHAESFGKFTTLPKPQQEEIDEYFEALAMLYKNVPVKFRLHTPIPLLSSIDHSEQYPLIVWFAGMGGAGDDNQKQLRGLDGIIPDLKEKKFFMLATQVSTEHKWWVSSAAYKQRLLSPEEQRDVEDSPAYITRQIVDELLRTMPIDKKRIYIVGFSDGCNAVSEFLKYNNISVCAAVMISGQPSVGTPVTDAHVALIYGAEDSALDEDRITGYSEKIKISTGRSYLYRCEQGTVGSRHDSHKAAFGHLKMIDWMLQHSR